MYRPSVRLLLLLLTVFLLPIVAGLVMMIAVGGLDNYQSVHAPSLSRTGPGERRVESVLLIVVDGLRVEDAQDMESYRYLAGQGAELTAQAPVPSLTAPSSATLATGATPEVHGIATNRSPGPVTADTIFRCLSEEGIPAVVVGGGWGRLVGDQADTYRPGDGAGVAQAARELLADRPGLLIAHFLEVDVAGHRYGATHPRYREAVDLVDGLIADLLADVDLSDTVVILLSDHGHIDAGGHGGSEPEVLTVPLVLAGPGTVPGAYEQVSLTDVAPTLAALLGAAQPVHASGRILVELLADVDRDALTGSLVASAQAASVYVQGLGLPPVRRVADIAMIDVISEGQYLRLMDELHSIRESAREERIRQVTTGRLLFPGIPLILLLAGVVIAAGRRQPAIMVSLALVPVLAVAVLGTVWPVSASRFADYGDAFVLFTVRGAAGALVTVLISAVAMKLTQSDVPVEAGLAVAGVCAAAAVLLCLAAVPGSGTLLARGLVPDLDRGLLLLTTAGALAGNAVAAPVMTLFAMKRARDRISA